MKKFNIPEHYKSSLISKVKTKRRIDDPLKKDFSPTVLDFGKIEFIISRHFGFCYGVENAIEKSYKAIRENPEKKIYLLSQMIHNPEVNKDLIDHGVQFIQDTDGSQLIAWKQITSDDIVIIPAFGTTVETKKILSEKGLSIVMYNTTCPFVEKVWNRSAKLGETDHTIIIHGKYKHEETKATFSHSKEKAPSLIVRDMEETRIIANFINGKCSKKEFLNFFEHKMSADFDPDVHLQKIGVVNQTTMLATETLEISNFLKQVMIDKYGKDHLKNHFADTRDTLCYATNDNQSATMGLLQTEADLAIVVGGYNSSNTSHLVELLTDRFTTYFVKNEAEIININEINSFDILSKKVVNHSNFLPNKDKIKIIITSGASCPDAAVNDVINKVLMVSNSGINIDSIQI